MKMFNEAIDNTRRKERRELEGTELEVIIKHARWCLLKNRANQNESQLAKLRELLKHNLKSVKCMLLRDSFQKFWTYRSSYWAKRFFDQWMDRVNRSNLDEMKKVGTHLQKAQDSYDTSMGRLKTGRGNLIKINTKKQIRKS